MLLPRTLLKSVVATVDEKVTLIPPRKDQVLSPQMLQFEKYLTYLLLELFYDTPFYNELV